MQDFLKKPKRKIRFYAEDFHIYLARKKIIRAHQDFTRFIILSRSRTGSNMLCSYLRQHPNIYIRNEILAKRKGKPVSVFLNRFFAVQPLHIKASGFKIFYYHPQDDNSGHVWDSLAKMKNLKIIHLTRSNLFHIYVSWKQAMYTDAWISGKNRSQLKNIKINPVECEAFFQKTTTRQKRAIKKFPVHKILEMTYEELVKYPSKSLERIQQFLNVPLYTNQLTTNTKKQQKKPLQDIVTNYKDIKNYFEGTPWHSFFE